MASKKNEEKISDISMISPELIKILTNQIKAELMANEPKQNKINEDDQEEKLMNKKVKVTSVSSGVVGVYLLNGRFVKWNKAGDSMRLKVEELVNINSLSPRYLNQPLLMIEDDETVEYFDLTDKYALLTKAKNVDELLKLKKDEIAKILSVLSREMRADISMDILRRIESGEIDSISMVEFLKRQLKLDVNKRG